MRKIYFLMLLLAICSLSLWSNKEPRFFYVIPDDSTTIDFSEAVRMAKLWTNPASQYTKEDFPKKLNWLLQEFYRPEISVIYAAKAKKCSSWNEDPALENKPKAKKKFFRDIKDTSTSRQPITVQMSKSAFKNENQEYFETLNFPESFNRPAMIVLLRSNSSFYNIQFDNRKKSWEKENLKYNYNMFVTRTNPADLKLSIADVAIVDLAN